MHMSFSAGPVLGWACGINILGLVAGIVGIGIYSLLGRYFPSVSVFGIGLSVLSVSVFR